MYRSGVLFLLYAIIYLSAFSQGIRGIISGEKDEALPFATIYIRSLLTGTTSNAEGYYDIKLSPGKYDLVFQFMGYETQVKVVEIASRYTNLNVLMKPLVIVLIRGC